ncbi:uncharacterized protein LOC100198390 [Hydra vulgaris]|uniref:uncharacterized protein LOC100198390 n=1 Tax=Hydra vulgaris TaxID=6087 RepID=UPI0002B47F72|nr:uncharacterized protein LOC100198390 [Hydra vulgaris]
MASQYSKMDVKKEEYIAVSGANYGQEKHAGGIIASQPQAVSGVENYILDLDAAQVSGWSVQDVCNLFVEKVGCGYLNELFIANKINGKCLMLLQETHLKEMGVQAIGDRVYMLEMISFLKKKRKEMQTTAALWSGETPAPGFQYSTSCADCLTRYLCPCCKSRTYWKVTGQGVFYRKVPPCGGNFGTVSTEYMDYRFFKDLELKEQHLCCCFCKRYQLELYVDDKDSKASEHAAAGFPVPQILLHPEAPKVEKIVRNAWSEARLVSE